MIASTIREPGTMYGDDGPIGEPDLLGKKNQLVILPVTSWSGITVGSNSVLLFCRRYIGSNREEGRRFV